MLCALIMAGGRGTRFWPLSTDEKPKQFLELIGNKSMIQMTVDRIKPIIPIDRIFVCTSKRYVPLVQEQLPELDINNIIVEPEGRNTAPCIALSALLIKRKYEGAKMVVLPADHLIDNEDRFRQIILKGNEFLDEQDNAILTLGMKPTRPEVGYGYIKINDRVNQVSENKIIKVDKFVEKPSMEKAKKYLDEGGYLWNGGMFLWTVENILSELKKYCTGTYRELKDILNIESNEIEKFIQENYKKTEATSIDYAILERTDEIYVIPCDIGWDDIGTWQAVERYREKDENNNIITENVKVIESKSNMTINNQKKIIMIGIEDVMTVETEGEIFIVNKNYMDKLKDFKEIL